MAIYRTDEHKTQFFLPHANEIVRVIHGPHLFFFFGSLYTFSISIASTVLSTLTVSIYIRKANYKKWTRTR